MPIEEQSQTILFVDDEESILEIAREHFQDMGYQVLTARNGREAVDTLDSNRVDCCFTDINMPGMDGLELAEYLRKTDNTIPVVIMTGYPSLDNTIKTLKNGVVDFLIKPVNLNQMTLCLQRVMRERELFIKNILLKKELEGKERIERLNRELSYRVSELRILNKIMSDLVALRTGAEVFDHMVGIAREISSADLAAFYLIGEAFDEPVQISALGSDGADDPDGNAEESRNPRGEENSARGMLGRLVKEVAADEVPLIIAENDGSGRLPANIHSFIGVPLLIRKSVFGVLIAAKHSGNHFFTEKDLYYLTFMSQQAAYMVENLALYENIYENLFSTLSAFVKAVEARDAYTKQHSNRVTEAAKIIAQASGCSKADIDVLDFAGRLHDIGKIGIRDDILLKPGPLSNEEFEKIKEHPIIGESIIGQLGLWDREKTIIRYHHERFDGSGYPDGLKGEEIPLLARILAIADVYDAMISGRAYRDGMPSNEVISVIKAESGRQFDPNLVRLFLDLDRSSCFAPIYRTVH